MKLLFDSFENNWEEWSEIKESLDCIPNSCEITGTLGLWNGVKTIEPVICDNISDAIDKCLGRDTEDIIFRISDNTYYLDAYHHDGINSFTIKILDE